MRQRVDDEVAELGREVGDLRLRMRDFELSLESTHRTSLELLTEVAGVRTALQSRNAPLGAFVVGCFFGGVLVLLGAVAARLATG